MNPQVETGSAAKAKEPDYRAQTKLTGAYFVESISFGGETTSANVGRNADSIAAARLEADGSAVAVGPNQRADGLLLRRRHRNTASNERLVLQCFVPFANVRCLAYGD